MTGIAWLLAVLFAAWPHGQGPGEAPPPRLLEEARQTALNYSEWLPDFICTEVVHRSEAYGPTGQFRNTDNLTLLVSYFQLHESYKLVARNNRPAQPNLEALAGVFSEGEFGSKLRLIFHPDSKAQLTFQEWKALGPRRVAVYSYRVERANSRFELRVPSDSVIAGYHGQVYIDAATNLTLRIEEALDVPEGFPIQDSSSTVEYDYVNVAGRKCLLPVRCETLSTDLPPLHPHPEVVATTTNVHPWEKPPYPATGRTGHARGSVSQPVDRVRYRNVIEFRDYRKYAADSTLKFDRPAEKTGH
jgi:hypothetical protein